MSVDTYEQMTTGVSDITSIALVTLIDQQCVVYNFKCDQCDAGYVGYTRGQNVAETSDFSIVSFRLYNNNFGPCVQLYD